MRILVASTTPATSTKGNRITAVRWARLLRELGHRVTVADQYLGGRFDLLVALHARRSAWSLRQFLVRNPGRPVVLALTGTDLYRDIHRDPVARGSLELATRLVLLQPMGLRELPRSVRWKARVIRQSTTVPRIAARAPGRRPRGELDLCVLGHLRPVKDPFRAAKAARLLPASSRIRIVHVGAAIAPGMAERARHEQARNPRYVWLGELPRGAALRRLARCRALVLTSEAEGGGNVIGEAICLGLPVVSSRISGVIGTLGPRYPGYFAVRNTRALAKLLSRLETDPTFYRKLWEASHRLRSLFDPRRERLAWRRLLAELEPSR